jgi:hypothetical protein
MDDNQKPPVILTVKPLADHEYHFKGTSVKKLLPAFTLLACGVALSQSAPSLLPVFKRFTGTYSIYGGGLGDPYAPKAGDRHMAFSVDGPLAKQMFNAMGPDLKGVCGAEDGGRIRERAEVSCSFSPNEGYHCDFGFDLTTGKSMGGSIC